MKASKDSELFPFYYNNPESTNEVCKGCLSEKFGFEVIDIYCFDNGDDWQIGVFTTDDGFYFFEYGSMGLRSWKIRKNTYGACLIHDIYFSENDAEYCYDNHTIIPLKEEIYPDSKEE